MNNFKKLIVVTIGSYPYGGASTNRHLSYLKGMVELGVDVEIFIIKLPENGSKNNNVKCGVYNGIRFEYMQPLLTRKCVLIKMFWKIKSRINAIFKTIEFIKNNNRSETKILDLLTSPIDNLAYLAISKIFGVKIFNEETEYPFLYKNSLLQKFGLQIYLKYLMPQFDGVFVITNSLLDYFRIFIKEETKLIHIPMTVEPERFTKSWVSINNNKYGSYIAYCGSMYSNAGIPMYVDKSVPVYGDKDGVLDLITAFNHLCTKVNNVNLLLIGDNNINEGFQTIQDSIDASPNRHRIFCTGLIDRNSIPEFLCGASVLAMSRPNNKQAQGGFPTKLGEYLATGNAVVVTDVGEISIYLQDGVSAYISPPSNPLAFSEKLFEALSDLARAKEIGEAGRNVMLKYFDYKVQSKNLYHFLNKK